MNRPTINEETLTFYYYNDGLSKSERQEVVNALASDPALADSYLHLSRQLDGLADQLLSRPPTDMVERWHDTIKTAAVHQASPTPKPAFHTWSFIWGAAITAALTVGIGIGVLLSGDETPPANQYEEVAASTNQTSAFERGLKVHFRESEESLSRLTIDSVSDKTELIMSIIEQNRLFERAAIRNDDQSVARVLRAFEIVLMRIAAEETTTEDAEKLRAKLLFELNIMLTKLSRDTSEEQQTI